MTAGNLASQCLELGLLDEIWLDLVPVLLGSGVRFFDQLGSAPIELDGPDISEGARVTHLRYVVRGHRQLQQESASMAETKTQTLDVPGAVLTYDVRSNDGTSRTPLLIIGSPMGRRVRDPGGPIHRPQGDHL